MSCPNTSLIREVCIDFKFNHNLFNNKTYFSSLRNMLLPLFSLLMDFSKLFLPRDNTEPSINQVESHVLKNQDSTVLTPHPWRCCRREGSSQEPSPARCAPHPPHPSGLFLCLPRASFPPIPPPLPQSQFAVFSYAILASVFHYSLKPQISGQQYGI